MIYCDLDGVLADFNQTFKDLTGNFPHEVSRHDLWKKVEATPNYWVKLDLIPDAPDLMLHLSKYPYQILTGLPMNGYHKAEIEKCQWVRKYVSSDIKIICCLSKDKSLYCKAGDILIDDFEPNIHRWVKAGGIGILHKNAADTIAQLKELGYE